MNTAGWVVVIVGALALLAAIGWALNKLDRRLTDVEDLVKLAVRNNAALAANHNTLAVETQKAFEAWGDVLSPPPAPVRGAWGTVPPYKDES